MSSVKSTIGGALVALGVLAAACGGTQEQLEHGALSVDEAVAAVHVPCLDRNQDRMISAADGAQLLQGGGSDAGTTDIDFNADGGLDERDAAFLGADLTVADEFDYGICEDASIEYLVGSATVPAFDCDSGKRAVIVTGVGGGVVDLRDASNAAGARWMVNALIDELESVDIQTLALISGPAVPGTTSEINAAMETWITNSVRTLLDQFPCANVVLLGHSHGAVTTDVAASRLEDAYGDRIVLVVSIDRISSLYFGDTDSRPQSAPVFNIYETNDADTHGEPYESPNVENWDASGEEAPSEGEGGGELEPVNHTTIDNSSGVRDRIIDEVMERLP